MKNLWIETSRVDDGCRQLADRHYSRQTVGHREFIGPGSTLVLKTENNDAVWVSLWQKHQRHRWKGFVNNVIFRNESKVKASILIRHALAHTFEKFRGMSPLGVISFIDAKQVRPKNTPGHSYIIAGFRPDGTTEKGLICMRIDWGALERIANESPPIHRRLMQMSLI